MVLQLGSKEANEGEEGWGISGRDHPKEVYSNHALLLYCKRAEQNKGEMKNSALQG